MDCNESLTGVSLFILKQQTKTKQNFLLKKKKLCLLNLKEKNDFELMKSKEINPNEVMNNNN